MGLLDKIVGPVRDLFSKPTTQASSGYSTITERSPYFVSWDGSLYEQAQTRAIVERIASACSKAKPEFVTPEGSGGSVPRVQRLFSSWPNDVMDWPAFIHKVVTVLLVETTAFIVPGYDRDGNISALWPMKPNYTELVEYEGEPWLRFHLMTGDVQAFPFYDVAIVTRFPLESDIFGGGNEPLTPTLRLMDAQRQAEEIALKTGADIRFLGKLSGMVHEKHMEEKRNKFAESNLGPSNRSRLMLYDQTFEEITPLKESHFTVPTEEMERIDKALFSYFGINEKILTNSYNEQEWEAFYEGCVEAILVRIGSALTKLLLSATQVRKGNHIMFSSSYLEYATTESKIKVAKELGSMGVLTFDTILDIFQLPHIPGGKARPVRGEIYLLDEDNNIIAESGGHNSTTVESEVTDVTDIDEPEPDEQDELTRAINARLSKMIDERLSQV